MGLGNWARFLVAHGLSTAPARVPTLVLATGICAFNSLVGFFSRLVVAKRVRAVELDPEPLFVLGHWRTGTTYLHELLSCDDRFIAPTGFQCYAPHIFIACESSLRPLLGFFIPSRRPMDAMVLNLDRSQEDEFAMLGLTGRSIYSDFVFPAAGPLDKEYLSLRALTPERREAWLEAWIYFLKSVAVRHRGRQKMLLKSPQHTARLRTILTVFPNAKFVYLTRDPFAVYPSTLRTWRALCRTQGLQGVARAEPWLAENVLATFEEMFTCYEEDKNLVPRGNLVEVRYEDLVADPLGQVAAIYRDLGLGDISRFEETLRQRIGEATDYRAAGDPISPGDAAVVRARWAGYFARHGYDQAKVGAPQSANI